MEEELKLKEDIAKVFLQYGVNMLGKNKPFPNEWEFSDQILALIHDAGYVPSHELQSIIDKAAEIIGTEESLRSIACIEVALDWLQRRVEERKDWRSPKEVESLVFQGILYADKGQVEEIKRRG